VLASNRALQLDGAGLVDLAPTILDLCGVPRPGHLHGRSLCPATTARAHPPDERSVA
jgi:arylsulfatase A-like enzyme